MTDNQVLAIANQLERIADVLESIDETGVPFFGGGLRVGKEDPSRYVPPRPDSR